METDIFTNNVMNYYNYKKYIYLYFYYQLLLKDAVEETMESPSIIILIIRMWGKSLFTLLVTRKDWMI